MKKQCIIMRSGSEFWVSETLGQKLSEQIVNQEGHHFIKLTEINRTINSADIVEILTEGQMDERNHLKNKDWRCKDMKWHTKTEKCFCEIEKAKERRRINDQEERDLQNRVLTPEEEEHRKKWFADTRKVLEDKGILAKKMHI